jgi:excisionase family DNA binding protein
MKTKEPLPRIAYSMVDAAAVSGVSRTTIYEAIRDQELRAVKLGARTIILHRDLCRWLNNLPPCDLERLEPLDRPRERGRYKREGLRS